jgi:hypothetical protein
VTSCYGGILDQVHATGVCASYDESYDGYGQTDVADDVGMKNSAFHSLINESLEI